MIIFQVIQFNLNISMLAIIKANDSNWTILGKEGYYSLIHNDAICDCSWIFDC